ncbi:caspase-1-A-like [Hippocampus comes]|uniref:Caspase-1-A-like n=1 Tax=Hippocampus comes TaxID=109280 RepID=A0A3Q2YLI7_HIPCM|nr:PREDICTED: caspase-1-A-like [Hippocampus comes]
MAEELKAVKIEFMEKVSSTVIEQLLDHLLHDNVLNSGEEEAIIEAHNTRRKRARILIDSVSKKGDEASWKMITYLQQKDPMLFKELGLPTESPQAASEVERQWSTTLIPCKRTFWNARKNEKDPKIYPVNEESKKNRVALLITNIKFKDSRYDRHGAEADERNMARLLRALGYEVVQYTNLTGEEIDKAVIDFSKHSKLKDTDSVFVVIMSHGKLGSVLGVNWTETQTKDEEDVFPVDNIFKHLGSANCKALLNKPKIIIIQACRGEEGGSVLIRDGAKALVSDNTQQAGPSTSDDGCIVHDGFQFVHKEKDFIALLSCTPDTVSYRHTVDGAFLIQYIVDVVNTCACEEDIEELFRMVMRRFEALPLVMKKQIPTKDRCTLSRRFYLFPGI